MNNSGSNWLKLRQVDELIEPYRSLSRSPRPRSGWLRAIRNALGMTTRQLAARLGMTHGNIARAEKAEAQKTISLETLADMASALDCELVYALVPRKPLRDVVEARAEEIARRQINRSGHNMALEDQAVNGQTLENLIEGRQLELLSGRWSKLWG